MYSLNQLVISGWKRRWILMDMETSLPLLYPLRYHIDHLAFRSLSTQSASLQSVKIFYEFWRQKYGVSFCYSFYSSDHNPDIAIGEMPAFWLYLENGHNVQSNVLSLTRVRKANSLTHTVRVRAVIHFISFLINTYISPAIPGRLSQSIINFDFAFTHPFTALPGKFEPDCSVFSKYQQLEDDSTPTRMRTHIPRHNINTFLAIAEISDHLQAMLMGRVDSSR